MSWNWTIIVINCTFSTEKNLSPNTICTMFFAINLSMELGHLYRFSGISSLTSWDMATITMANDFTSIFFSSSYASYIGMQYAVDSDICPRLAFCWNAQSINNNILRDFQCLIPNIDAMQSTPLPKKNVMHMIGRSQHKFNNKPFKNVHFNSVLIYRRESWLPFAFVCLGLSTVKQMVKFNS